MFILVSATIGSEGMDIYSFPVRLSIGLFRYKSFEGKVWFFYLTSCLLIYIINSKLFLKVMRDLINEYMEDVKQAAGVQSPVKVSEDSGMFPPKLPSSHGVPREVNNYKEVSLDSTAMTISNLGFGEQQSQTKYTDKSKAVDDAFSRDYERRHYGNHSYGGAQQNADRGTYHRDRASSSPDRQISHSRARDHSIRHKRKDYSNRKRYDDSSRTRDRREKDTQRNYISDSSLNNAFSDRYDPSESLHVREDDINSDAKYIKPDKFYDQELH